jgi:hypothetical protein
MKLRKAERMPGGEIRRIGGASAKVSYGAYDGDGELVAEATNAIEDLALEFLVKNVYQVHSVQALKDNNWRCAMPWSHAFADSPSPV